MKKVTIMQSHSKQWRGSSQDKSLPIDTPYKSWSLEKLQQQYFLCNLQRIAAQVKCNDLENKIETIYEFIEALEKMMKLVHEEQPK